MTRRRYWSRYYPSCLECKSRYWPHKGRGYCSSCYAKHYEAGEFEGTVPHGELLGAAEWLAVDEANDRIASAYEAAEYRDWLTWHLYEHFPIVYRNLPKPVVGSRPVWINDDHWLRDSPESPIDDVLVFDELLHWMCGEADRLGLDGIWIRLEGVDDELDGHIELLKQTREVA